MIHPTRMRASAIALLGTAIVVLSGCAVPSYEPGAQEIEILEEERLDHCEQLGQTRVSVAEELGFIPRGDKSIRKDIQVLARNSALSMGGDTIAPLTDIIKGERTYAVYDCVDE